MGVTLTPTCQLYRSRCESDRPLDLAGHAGRCPSCRQYAELITRLPNYGDREPLPLRMQMRLERVQELRPALGRPTPLLPIPTGLERRLRALVRRPLPSSVVRAGYSIAASYLLVVSMALNLGNPYQLGRGVALEVSDLVTTSAEQWNRRAQQRLRAESEALALYGERLRDRVRSLQQELASAARLALPREESSDGRDPGSEPASR